MSQLNIKFLQEQMAALRGGTKTEEEVCKAIEDEVCEGIFHERDLSELARCEEHMLKREVEKSDLRIQFEALGKHYADMVTFDPYVDRQEPEDTTNEY